MASGIQKRTAGRDDEQGATPHMRSRLIPERQLARELSVLVDPGFHLKWSVHPTSLREVVGNSASVMLTVAAASDPIAHVVPVCRRERQDVDELHASLVRKSHQEKSRLHRLSGCT